MGRIILVPGHNADNVFKRSKQVPPGVIEYEFNAAICDGIEPIVPGCLVVPSSVSIDFANSTRPKLLLSIHANASPTVDSGGWDPRARGVTAFVSPQAAPMARLVAKKLSAAISGALYTTDRGTKEVPFNVVQKTRCPAVLLECGFMTHPTEATMLASDYWRQCIISSITRVLKSLKGIVTV